MQAQIQDGLGLSISQAITVFVEHAVITRQLGRARGLGTGAPEHGGHLPRRPHAAHQPVLGLGRAAGGTNQGDDLIDIGQRHGQAFQNMGPRPCLGQVILRASGHDLAPMADEGRQHLLEAQRAWLAVVEGDHVDAEHGLHL